MEIYSPFAILTSKSNEIYYLISIIGEGATSFVYRCISENHHEYALKLYLPKEEQSYNNEISILRKLKHSNVLNLINYGEGKLEACLDATTNQNKIPDVFENCLAVKFEVLEYFQNGEWFDYISLLKQGFPNDISKQIFHKIVSIVHYCHENGVYHNDLKWENILLSNSFDIKWIDFGFSTFSYDGSDILHNWKGTRCYASPDINHTATKGFSAVKNDCFALGVILFIWCVGTKPFNMPSFSDVHYKSIIQGDYLSFWKMFPGSVNLDNSVKKLIMNLLAYDSDDRFNTDQIWKSDWMSSYLNNEKWENCCYSSEGKCDKDSEVMVNGGEFSYQKEFEYRKIIVDTTKMAKLM